MRPQVTRITFHGPMPSGQWTAVAQCDFAQRCSSLRTSLPSFLKEYLNSAVLDVFSLTLGRAPGKRSTRWCTCCGKGPRIGWVFGVLARPITGTRSVSHQLIGQTNEFN